jgi:poly(hydroxyalkanoate) depolymerase family esterase
MRKTLVCISVIVALVSSVKISVADPKWRGSFERYSYTNEFGTRQYMLYVPSKLKKDATLVVYLHGCTQTADQAALGSRYNDLAEEEGFLVAYPEQDPAANGSRCWNWFLPDHMERDAGEPSIIAGITRTVMEAYPVSPSNVFVNGISAGGSMSGIMAATYPDLYAAAAISAAPAYKGDSTGQLAFQAMGDHARAVPTIIFQGTADALVNYPVGRGTLYQWLGTDELADDNDSVSTQPEIENRSFDQQPQPGSGDPCIPPPNGFPCLGGVVGFQGEYPHTIERYLTGGGEVMVEFWSIHGLGHAIAYGDRQGTFTDALGPDVRRAAYDFFMAHPMSPEEE